MSADLVVGRYPYAQRHFIQAVIEDAVTGLMQTEMPAQQVGGTVTVVVRVTPPEPTT